MSSRITHSELAELLLKEPATRLLDVRTGGEFDTAHIAGSYHVPLDDLPEHAPRISAINDTIVLVCQSGGRATKAHATLTALGMSTVRVLDGGIAGWQQAGRPVNRGAKQRWGIERQVRLVAGSIVAASILASLAFSPLKWVAGAIGAGLTFAALTDTCAMGMLLARLPYNRATAVGDAPAGVRQLLAEAGRNPIKA